MDQQEALLIIRTFANEPVYARFLLGWLLARCSEAEVLAALDAVRSLDERRQAATADFIADMQPEPPLF